MDGARLWARRRCCRCRSSRSSSSRWGNGLVDVPGPRWARLGLRSRGRYARTLVSASAPPGVVDLELARRRGDEGEKAALEELHLVWRPTSPAPSSYGFWGGRGLFLRGT